MNVIKNINYSEYEECMLDIYLPDSKSFSVFVYFHGGGLESGNKTVAQVLAEYLTEKNIAVVSANYRMYPKSKYPDYIVDAASCVSWVFSNINNYGKCDSVYVGGSSAGAYLSMMLCFDSKYLSKHGILPTQISGYIHDAGQPTCHYNILREKSIDTKRVIVDETAPLYHVGKEDKYSEMLFILSNNDLPNRYEQTILLMSTLRHFGHHSDIEVLHGTHSQYIQEKDNGESVLGKVVEEYIKKWRNKDC